MYHIAFKPERLGDTNCHVVSCEIHWRTSIYGREYSFLADRLVLAGFVTELSPGVFIAQLHACRTSDTPSKWKVEYWTEDLPGYFTTMDEAVKAIGDRFDPVSHGLEYLKNNRHVKVPGALPQSQSELGDLPRVGV